MIAEFVLPHWWQGIFHNQSALALKLALKFRPDTVVVNVPFHLAEDAVALEEHAGSLGLERERSDQRPRVDRIDPTIGTDTPRPTSDPHPDH